jgi:hypothetical protein
VRNGEMPQQVRDRAPLCPVRELERQGVRWDIVYTFNQMNPATPTPPGATCWGLDREPA